MGRHRSAGATAYTPSDPSRRSRIPSESPRRAAKAALREEARRERRTARSRRRRSRGRRAATLSPGQRLLALPWTTFVLLLLVVVGVVGLVRPATYEARSTVTAATAPAAAQAAVALTRTDVVGNVEDEVELEPHLRGDVALTVERPADTQVVVIASAPDPRLAALAADTAAALVVEGDGDLTLSDAAVVPTRPTGIGTWWPWAAAGGTALLLALAVERRRDLGSPGLLPAEAA
ncbi:hypothetical protein GCM10009584_10810 [Ornithinimicrobium humiphilum]|jgi:hypothetical protein|uniref:Capsular polysaccharide biosynthesis protein n=1 Tax=Ornithinimicrobium humiphilum TaxID=125288 RepID=A0A543KJD5_9MICO|nr:hypothetical protein [Ornithinimicrobium humiphilum]TQM95189.1 hypothetical protein FB476_0022 [Ornithinimicrobium humiphilum]